jgi:hypothetical protein
VDPGRGRSGLALAIAGGVLLTVVVAAFFLPLMDCPACVAPDGARRVQHGFWDLRICLCEGKKVTLVHYWKIRRDQEKPKTPAFHP